MKYYLVYVLVEFFCAISAAAINADRHNQTSGIAQGFENEQTFNHVRPFDQNQTDNQMHTEHEINPILDLLVEGATMNINDMLLSNLAQYNTAHRERSKKEKIIRTLSGTTHVGSDIRVYTEIGEAGIHFASDTVKEHVDQEQIVQYIASVQDTTQQIVDQTSAEIDRYKNTFMEKGWRHIDALIR